MSDSKSPSGSPICSTVELNVTQTGDATPLVLDSTTAATHHQVGSPNVRLLAQLPAAQATIGVQPDVPDTEISLDQLSRLFPQLDITGNSFVLSESDSVLPTDDEFNLLLIFHAHDWSMLYIECHNQIAFLILRGCIQPSLHLSEGVTRLAINHAIYWRRFAHNEPLWIPSGVSDLNIKGFTFSASLDDPVFQFLFHAHLGNIPTAFFNQVRIAMRALLSPPLPNSLRQYPRSRLIRNIALLTTDDENWLRHLLDWDARWGYTYWHVINSNSSGVSVRWFANLATRDMLYHALRHNGSIGWLSVLAPDQDDERFLIDGIPAIFQMVVSTLTAITIEMAVPAGLVFCPPGVHPRYVAVFSIMRARILAFLSTILDGTNAALDHAAMRDALRGLKDLLKLLPVNE